MEEKAKEKAQKADEKAHKAEEKSRSNKGFKARGKVKREGEGKQQ